MTGVNEINLELGEGSPLSDIGSEHRAVHKKQWQSFFCQALFQLGFAGLYFSQGVPHLGVNCVANGKGHAAFAVWFTVMGAATVVSVVNTGIATCFATSTQQNVKVIAAFGCLGALVGVFVLGWFIYGNVLFFDYNAASFAAGSVCNSMWNFGHILLIVMWCLMGVGVCCGICGGLMAGKFRSR